MLRSSIEGIYFLQLGMAYYTFLNNVMLSFKEFVAESENYDPYDFDSLLNKDSRKYGYLRPGQKPIYGKSQGTHRWIAKKAGFEDNTDALKHGWVRFFHVGKNYRTAGYEFHDTPESKDMVSKHLRKSGGFGRIMMDVHHTKGNIKSHQFRSVNDALNHLEQK